MTAGKKCRKFTYVCRHVNIYVRENVLYKYGIIFLFAAHCALIFFEVSVFERKVKI